MGKWWKLRCQHGSLGGIVSKVGAEPRKKLRRYQQLYHTAGRQARQRVYGSDNYAIKEQPESVEEVGMVR